LNQQEEANEKTVIDIGTLVDSDTIDNDEFTIRYDDKGNNFITSVGEAPHIKLQIDN